MTNQLSRLKICSLAVPLAAFLVVSSGDAQAERVGSVDTKFNLLSPDDEIVIEAFDDPQIDGVTCHMSRANKGGWSGTLGLAEDTSDASIACRQTGPIKINGELEDGERVFSQRASLIFKKVQVVRFFDEKRNTLIYLAYSDKIIEGSPKNSISTVPILDWPGSCAACKTD